MINKFLSMNYIANYSHLILIKIGIVVCDYSAIKLQSKRTWSGKKWCLFDSFKFESKFLFRKYTVDIYINIFIILHKGIKDL